MKTVWRSVASFFVTGDATPVSGHDYALSEVHEHCRVEIVTCAFGKTSIAWEPRA